MKPISYRAVGKFRKERKLKSGLAPTGVLRQNLVLHNSFQAPIYAAQSQKTNAGAPTFTTAPPLSRPSPTPSAAYTPLPYRRSDQRLPPDHPDGHTRSAPSHARHNCPRQSSLASQSPGSSDCCASRSHETQPPRNADLLDPYSPAATTIACPAAAPNTPSPAR